MSVWREMRSEGYEGSRWVWERLSVDLVSLLLTVPGRCYESIYARLSFYIVAIIWQHTFAGVLVIGKRDLWPVEGATGGTGFFFGVAATVRAKTGSVVN